MKTTSLVMISILLFSLSAQSQTTHTMTTNPDGSVTSTSKSVEPGLTTNISVTQSKKELEQSSKDGEGFQPAVVDCSPYSFTTANPMIKGSTITMQVHGLVNGKCKLTQSMQQEVLLTCLLSEQQRAEFKMDKAALQKYMMDESVCSTN
jgi:hypothetical protein